MRFIADLHIHSRFSRATSRSMSIPALAASAAIKGINLLGTGDFTHPAWLEELRSLLEPAEPGLFRMKNSGVETRFMLTAEISTIFSRGGRVYKTHSLILAESFETVKRVNAALARIGNLASDGRPILGMDMKNLLSVVIEASDHALFVPAHAWTPHFSIFGSKSGFDSPEEAFGDLLPYVYAIETGLSSDPPMNRTVSALDRFALISNSDAHSPGKLGREANIFNTDLSFHAIADALRRNDTIAFEATIEFFPEEGKYHHDGHRACGVNFTPAETRAHGFTCPACGKPVTVGVLHRVHDLSDRDAPMAGRPHLSMVPLAEIISEASGVGPSSKKAAGIYDRLIAAFGTEFAVLLYTPPDEIDRAGFSEIARAIAAMRDGRARVTPGFDGEYGRVELLAESAK